MKEELKNRIIETIDRSRPEQISFLRKLIQAKSVNPSVTGLTDGKENEPVEVEAAKLVFSKLKDIGFNPRFENRSSSRPNVICEFGRAAKGGRNLIFNGHLDTVPPAKGYSFAPFSGAVKNGRVYGLGALDMKASLCAYVFMAKALRDFQQELKGRICLQFVSDEESGADSPFGTKFLLKKGYRGSAAIVGEPGMEKISIGSRGGYRFKIETFGEAAHTGSRDWEEKTVGRNAILEMTKAINALSSFPFKKRGGSLFSGRKNVLTFPTFIEGGTSINMVPDYCRAYGDARILPGVSKDFMERTIKGILRKEGIKFKLSTILYIPASIKSGGPLVGIVAENAFWIQGRKPKIGTAGPWSDAWLFIKRGIPAINFGCDGNGAHGKDEYVEIESMIDATKIYALTAVDYSGS
jgi:acetylornithine deacetylase